MKKNILFMASALCLNFYTIAQTLESNMGIFVAKNENNSVNMSFLFCPQGQTNLNTVLEKGWSAAYPLHLVFMIRHGKWTITPMYTLTANLYGGFVKYDLTKNVGIYTKTLKQIDGPETTSWLGLTSKIINLPCIVFIEAGKKFVANEPIANVGVIIPFTIWEIR